MARSLKSGCWQGGFLLEVLMETCSMFLPCILVVAGNPWHSLSCRCITSISAPYFMLLSLCVRISVFFHLVRALVNGLRPTINQYVHSLIYYMCNDTISRWGHLLRIQVRSLSKDPGDMNLGCTLSTQYNQHVKPSASSPHASGLFAKKATACFKLFLKKLNLLYLYIL